MLLNEVLVDMCGCINLIHTCHHICCIFSVAIFLPQAREHDVLILNPTYKALIGSDWMGKLNLFELLKMPHMWAVMKRSEIKIL